MNVVIHMKTFDNPNEHDYVQKLFVVIVDSHSSVNIDLQPNPN